MSFSFSFFFPYWEPSPSIRTVAFIIVITFLQLKNLFVWNHKAWNEEYPAFHASHLQWKHDKNNEDKTNTK